jgi:hypothetical protein
MHDTRAGCIVHHVNMALRKSALTQRGYGQAVADLYLQRTPLHARTLEFHASRDPYADEAANAQLVKRLLNGTVRVPVDVEEAMVLALPEPFRGACLTDLAGRYGLLAAPRPTHEGLQQTIHLGELARDAGETMIALAPMFADGRIAADDAPLAAKALASIAGLQALLVTMEASIRVCAVPRAREAAPCAE